MLNKKQCLKILFFGFYISSFFGSINNKPATAAEKVECGEGAKVSVVNGVIVCVNETKVEVKPKCDTANYKTEVINVYHSTLNNLVTLLNTKSIPCVSIIGTIDKPNSILVKGLENFKLSDNSIINPLDDFKKELARLDIPLERVNMDIWTIELASADSARLANVMNQVNREIDQTRNAMQLTYRELTNLSRRIDSNQTDPKIRQLLSNSDPNGNQKLSLADVLFRINMANKAPDQLNLALYKNKVYMTNIYTPQIKVYDQAAEDLCKFFVKNRGLLFTRFNRFEALEIKNYEMRSIFSNDLVPPFRRPFQRFQEVALHQNFPLNSQPKCNDGNLLNPTNLQSNNNEEQITLAGEEWTRRQKILKDYVSTLGTNGIEKSIEKNNIYGPKLDSMLSSIVDAISLDIEDYFIKPTLHRIKEIVGRDRSVEYAEVGKLSLSGRNGEITTIKTSNINSFDEPTPLRLNELIKDASETNKSTKDLFPNISKIPLPGALNSIDAATALSTIAALSKEDPRWRTMSNGINLTITPTVLRDRTTALLNIDFTRVVPEKQSQSISDKNPLRAPSQTSVTELKSKVQVNVWDLFALSSLNNQTTITGRRWNVPIVGPVWEGIFGDIPVVGNLLSPRRPPVNIQHQTVMITNTLIVPSARGIEEANPELNLRPNPYQNNLNVQHYQDIQNNYLSPIPFPQPAPRN